MISRETTQVTIPYRDKLSQRSFRTECWKLGYQRYKATIQEIIGQIGEQEMIRTEEPRDDG